MAVFLFINSLFKKVFELSVNPFLFSKMIFSSSFLSYKGIEGIGISDGIGIKFPVGNSSYNNYLPFYSIICHLDIFFNNII